MDGFKNSTKTHYMAGGSAKRAEAKMGKVMGEFAAGKLHSGSKKGPEVKNPKQAVAIAMSEARKAGAKAPMKKFDGGGVYNERGKRATWAETAAEGRRMEGRKPPVEGISTRPTDDSGRRMTNEELGMTPGGVAPKKKAMPKGMGAMSNLDMERAKKKAMPKVMSDLERARMMARPLARKEGGGVPAHSDRPLIRRSKGGLSAMPKGKC
jgi:hypothetical protein